MPQLSQAGYKSLAPPLPPSRRLAESIQPMTQAEDGMLPGHTRPGVAHHVLDLLAARALVAVDGALGAGWLCRAKAAAFQPHGGIIQESLAFRTEGCVGPMMVAAMNSDHRLHRLPFARQRFAHKSNRLCFPRGGGKGVRRHRFNGPFHALILAYQSAGAFDAGQRFTFGAKLVE